MGEHGEADWGRKGCKEGQCGALYPLFLPLLVAEVNICRSKICVCVVGPGTFDEISCIHVQSALPVLFLSHI